jgi:hypothetical protein
VIPDDAERGFAIHVRRTAVRRSPACLCAVAILLGLGNHGMAAYIDPAKAAEQSAK